MLHAMAAPCTAPLPPPGRSVALDRRRRQLGRGRSTTAAATWFWDALTGGGDSSTDKVLHLVRHGETEMNVHLGLCSPAYGEPGFTDPLLHDTRLTPNGRRQAARAAAAVARLRPEPDIVVVSPLTRALQTADAAFEGRPWPRMVQPLAAERLYLSSDVGRPREQLEREFPHYAFHELPQERGRAAAWWHTSWDEESEEEQGEEDLLAIAHEPEDVFLRRVEELRQWLAARPEQTLALVSHWGVLQALTGVDFDNCEVRTVRLRQLRARPHLLAEETQGGRASLV